MIESAIQTILTSQSPNPFASGSRISAGRAREGWAEPYIIHFLVGGAPRHYHDGPDDVRSETIQVSAFASTYGSARREIEAVRAVLDGYAGAVGDVTIKSCLASSPSIVPDPEAQLWHAVLEFDIEYA